MKAHSRHLRRYLAIGLLVLLGLVAAVLLSAGSWLESDSGRNLLQRELSKALGLEADFRGEYSLRLFPVIRIAGADLALRDEETGLTIVSVDSYELHLALRPLLRKEVNILKVAIHDGILDLDRLADYNSGRATNAESDSRLPGIRDLEITHLLLQKSAVDFLLIVELNLFDFAENQQSPITMELALDRSTAGSKNAHLEGLLQVTATPFTIGLLVEELTLQFSEQKWSLGQGELNWSAEQQKVWGELSGSLASYSSRYVFSVLSADALQINLSADLQGADMKTFGVNLEAQDASDFWDLKTVDLILGEQKLGGTGCFSQKGEPLLQLQLEAKQLDLDALQDLVPAGLFPPELNAKVGEPEEQALKDSGLPIQLAISLSAEQLTWSGATANSVRLLVGAEPDCTASSRAIPLPAPQQP